MVNQSTQMLCVCHVAARTHCIYQSLYFNNEHTHTTVLRPCFQDHPGEPVPEEIFFWTLWFNGRITEADTPTIQI